jgi:4-hydroxy-tetrahydrodipicolinate synthase
MTLTGLFAALATPVDARGDLDLPALDRLCDFLLERGVDGLVLGGATSEYPRFELSERLALIERVARRVPAGTILLTAIGSSSVPRMLALARAAADAGSRAVLLPMPMFFRYRQEDLAAYCSHLAAESPLPCVLYDLRESPNPLEAETAIALLEREPQIIGIKDSSGKAENLRRFVDAREAREWSLLVGDDRYLLDGLTVGWNGGISGLACCVPELLVALHRSAVRGDQAEAQRFQGLLEELIAQLSGLPTPWGVRVALAARGIETGPLPLPLAPERARQLHDTRAWLADWLTRAEIPGLLTSTPGARG